MADNLQYDTDQELLTAARQGNQDAYKQLFEKYWQDLYEVAYKRLRSREDARDIIQDVFLSFFKSIHTIELGESLAGYLFTAVRNRVFNHFEKQTVRLKILLAQPMNPVQSEELIWSNMRTKELRDIIAAEIRQLPPKMREIYQLSRDEQLTIGEIAKLLILSPQTVKNQLYQALQRIRISLKKQKLDSFLFFI